MHMQDADKKKQLLPDEGLPMVKPEIVEHLEKDVHDPDSQKLLGTVRDYCSQKDKLHNQVKFILAKSRNNNPQTVHKAQEMRQAALTTWAQIQTEMSQKIKDDDRITEFDNGQRFFITLIGAENLPMQDQVTLTCGCAVCWRGAPACNPHIAQPAA
jgi:soluble cytochrome b562